MTMAVEAACAKDAFEITADDDTAIRADALYIGTGGDVAVTTARGTTITIPNVPDGAILPITVVKVKSTNTTASDIVGLLF